MASKKIKKSQVLEYVDCNLCGSDDYTIIYRGKPEDAVDLTKVYKAAGDDVNTEQIVKCNQCGLLYVNPRIKGDLIVEGYASGPDKNFVSQAHGRELTSKRTLDYVERFVLPTSKKNKKAKKGKILDIGTAGGSFLHVAKESGWDVAGVEPNAWMVEWGNKHYKLNTKAGTIHTVHFPSNQFDVVTLWDVLEHVPDPGAELQEINRILKKGGYLVVNYPDIGSWIARIMRSKWMFLLNVHLWYFTPDTITKLLQKHGYKVVKIRPHFQSLSLGYLVFRMRAYSKVLHKAFTPLTKAFRMENVQIPYWLGQTLVIAKKR